MSAPGADDQNPIHFEFQEVAEAAAPTGSGATADKQSDRISPLGDGRRMRVPSAIVASTSIYDAGGRIRTRIESLHRRTAALDRTAILLNDLVEILAGPHLHVFPLGILPS